MLRIQTFSTRVPGSPAGRTARFGAVSALVALAVVGSACSGSPMAPGSLTADRRVQTGGGGGTFCPGGACGLEGRVEVVAGGGTLNGPSAGSQSTREPIPFTFTARLAGTGRFDEGFLDIAVASNVATIHTAWFAKSGKVFQDTDKTVTPQIVQTATEAKDCASGVMVETTLRANLQNFGSTTIVERHCAQ